MEATSYSTMEYSLSDIQLPDPPKEKDSSESLNENTKEINPASNPEKNIPPKNEEELEQSHNSTKEESNGCAKKLCEPLSPKTSEANQDSEKDHADKPQCPKSPKKKNDVKEVCKSLTKEGNKHKTSEVPSATEESTDVKDSFSKSDVSKESTIPEKNSEPLNDVCASKQNETEVKSKNSLDSSSKRSKRQEHAKSRKHATVSTSKGKSPQKADTGDPTVDKDSTDIVCKRRNRRTRHSSSQSSSSDSSSSNRISPDRASSHSKKSGKSGSSSEGIASPSISKSSSSSESEESKKCPSTEKPKTAKISPVTNSEEVAKPRRKINRNLAVKGFQESEVIKEAEPENTEIPSTASSKVKKDDTDNVETTKKIEPREIKFTPRKLSLSSTKSSEKSEEQDSEKPNSKLGVRKRKWGSCTATLPRTSVSISSDSLKTLIPDLKPFTVTPVLSDQDELSNPVSTEFPLKKETKIVNLPAPEEMVHEEISTHLLTDKASSAGDTKDSPNESPACVSPPHNPTSNSLFIKNLVRPFTLLQLRELLKQTGTVVEEKFWIDKIKSKCIVTYETEEQAVTTRNTLHGTRWPLSNPKILAVDFCSEEELDVHRNMTEQPKPVKVTQQVPFERQDVKDAQAVDVPKRKNREEHKREKERQKIPVTHVREWDKDKLSQDSPEQTSHRAEKDTDKSRSDKRKEKKDSKRRVDDDAPAKLLDDLFRKTRASPCIYWLPLTEEQAKQREEERQARRMEREKWWQQRKEQEENERRNRTKGHSGREKENRRSQSRSRSPPGRRR